MRLLKLEVENLNALYGTHAIDFRADLQDAPLFLISGPTGAGKSTLLDAISLALFGVTPRLSDKGSGDAKRDVSPAHALSRGTALGRAVLAFRKASPDGGSVTYRATWKVWRGHVRSPKAEGKVQGPYRWLDRLDEATGEWTRLATDYPAEQGRARDLEAALEEALEGFNLADFTRCMLLAQGDFAAFLKATEAERSLILERLTRTERYQALGGRAADRWRKAKEACDRIETELGGLQVLDEAALEALRQDLAEACTGLAQARDREDTARTALAWLDQDLALFRELAAAEARLGEAEAALREAAPDLDRLAAFEAAQEALSRLAAARAARDRVNHLEAQVADCTQETATLETFREAKLEEGKAAATALAAAQEAIQAQEPAIREAREARQALAAATKEMQQAEGQCREAQTALAQTQQAAQDATSLQASAVAVLADAAQALEAAPWEALSRDLAGLEARQATLLTAREGLHRDQNARQALASELDTLAPDLTRAQAALQALRPRLDTLTAEAEAADRDRARHLDGQADTAAARRGLERRAGDLRARGEGLRDLQRRVAALDGARLEALTRTHTAAQVAQAEAEAERLAAATALEAARHHHGDQVRDLDLMRWARDLVQERGRLGEGQPCPLCGSQVHPALHDPDQAGKDAAVAEACARLEATLKASTAALDAAEDRHRQAEAEAVRRETETLSAQKALEIALAEDQAARQRLAAEAAALDLPLDAAALDTALAELAASEGVLAEAQAALNRVETDHQAAHHALKDALLALQKAEADVDRAQERQRALTQRLADADHRVAQTEAQVRELEAQAAADAGSFGLPEADPLAEARRRVQAFLIAKDGMKDAERRLEAASRDADLKAQALDLARHQEVQAQAEAASRRDQVQAAKTRCAAALGGEDPDPLEASLREAVHKADRHLTTLREAYAKAKEEAGRALGALEATRRQAQEALAVLTTTEAALESARAPFGSEAELESRALPPEEVQRLEATRQSRQRAQVEAASALETHRRQSLAHAAQRPGEVQETDRATLQAEREAAQAEARSHQEAAVRAQVALEAQEAARQASAEVRVRLDAARSDLSLWTRMKDLIGTGDGEAFRRFAQVLNLRDLLAKANARLERLRPRYRLVPATGAEGERLAFAVEDAAHAGEVRPVGTLSGGETFLVSLSLALALADYRTVRMPIETLLLDEGFGTLDPSTLADVLGTLGALTSQGTQVGIISHVEALQERIPARIRVEPAGQGRSRVLIPGGAQGS